MTEQKEPSAIPEDKVSAETSVTEKPQSQRDSGKKLAVLAIIVALAAGAASAGYIRHLDRTQMAENQLLSAELTQLRHQSANDRQQLTAQLNQTEEALRITQQQQDASAKTLDALKEKVASLTGDNSSVWLVAQADYLVKLAGRKLWSDQDVTTAIALLKSADHSLADINDPSILNIRRALTHDISTLSNLNQVDYDGLILQLNQLSSDIDGLQLADDNDNSSPMDADSREISGSLAQWRQNLVNSWHDFMDNFITIRRRDTTAQPLLAPNQNIYLRENIRSKLLIAAQAVPRHQQEIYKQSLEAVSTWVRSWYSAEDPATKAFLSQTEQLEQQPVVMDLPETLDSQPLIDKLMQVRVRGLMSQPAAAMPETAKQQGG